MTKHKINIDCNMDFLSRYKPLTIFALLVSMFLLSSSQVMAQYDEDYQEEETESYSQDKRTRNDDNRGFIYDERNQQEIRKRRQNKDEQQGSFNNGIPQLNFKKNNQQESDIAEKEVIEIDKNVDPDKANEEIDPDEDPRHDHPPSNPSEPDLPIDGGVGFALVGGILYATRQLLKNKKAV